MKPKGADQSGKFHGAMLAVAIAAGMGAVVGTATSALGQDFCCLEGGLQCVPMDPIMCQQIWGYPPPAGMCMGDLNGNNIDDGCEMVQQPEACCMPDGRCHVELPGMCWQQGGVPQGPGSMCMGDGNHNGVDDACEGLALKFIQRPDVNRTGIDIKATEPNILADDFLCQRRSLITHVTVWGSWKHDITPPDHMVSFTLSVHADIPASQSPTGYSMPGQVLWHRTFEPGSYLFQQYMDGLEEYWWDPLMPTGWLFPGDTTIWQYDFDIPASEAFCQQGSMTLPMIYWLDVQAHPMLTTEAEFGWKTVTSPDSNFMDAAVACQGVEPYAGPWNRLVYPMPGHVWYLEDIGLAFAISGDQTCPEGLLEYGDAPENALAYPATGMMGQFPTCVNTGPALFVQHNNFGANFGPIFDFETEGNAGQCPLFNPNNYDRDECFQDNDAGLMFPPAYTIQGPQGQEQVVPCTSQVGPLGQICQTATWGVNADIMIHNWMPNHPPYVQGYVNVLMDWDHDGQWSGGSPCPTGGAPEHVLVNWIVPPLYDGTLSALAPPGFLIGPNPGYVWTRFSITEAQVPVGWDGSGVFEDGESEDYLLLVDYGQPQEYDWGDAPDPTYPTLSAFNGASHVIGQGLMLGNLIDAEGDGQPDPNALGDDNNNLDDEEGVTFNNALFSGVPNTIRVTATVPAGMAAVLNAWLDLNGNGSWADPGEQIFTNQAIVNGPNPLTFTPGPITAMGSTFARFRLSTMQGLSYVGQAPDGEVEDYEIEIVQVKWLQRPDLTTYGVDVDNYWVQLADDFRCTQSGPITDIHIWTSFADDMLPPLGLTSLKFTLHLYADVPAGPNNEYSHPGDRLWSRTFDPGSYHAGMVQQQQPEWWYDPATNTWRFPGDTKVFQYDFYIPQAEAYRQVEGTIYWLGVKYDELDPGGCTLGWKSSLEHWNDDACWLDTSMPVPVWRELRYGDGHPMAQDSMDLAFAITGMYEAPPDDFGDAPDPNFPTLLASNGARHQLSPIYMGNQIDGEPDGLQSPDAKGDDNNNLDDEDGVSFDTPLIPGQQAQITVTVTAPPVQALFLNGWIDYNGDGSWATAGDSLFVPSQPVGIGPNVITFIVPATATPGISTFARFRLHTKLPGEPFFGPATCLCGEVEDYTVVIEEELPTAELGDAPDSSNSFLLAPMTAYPAGGPLGVQANYPTVYQAGSPPWGPIHRQPLAVAFLGQAVTLENEADIGPDQDPTNNIIPPADQPDRDAFDDGVRLPLCLPSCTPTQFNYIVTLVAPPPGQQLFVNVWFDWTRNGDWDDVPVCPDGTSAPEWAVQNQMLPLIGPGVLPMTTPPFLPWHPLIGPGDSLPIWMRITLSEVPWQPGAGIPGYGGSGPANGYQFGETEDYYFVPSMPPKVSAAVSRKLHPGAGSFDVDICAGQIECRDGGPTLVEVRFDRPIQLVTGTPADVAVSSGVVNAVAQVGPRGLQVTMSGAANAQPLTMTFPGVADATDITCISQGQVCLRVLRGDVTDDAKVNIFDLIATRNQLNQAVVQANFRADVTVDGSINIFDLILIRNNINTTVGPCPGPYCQ